ncbi:TetR/AcrR family transcriptional regulator [Anthocerotibacter panamensis]|uniref:TetR/AcrR family transcriptional regulator n=1 Tax=Anthocerotibacter panamensis TaxID=2857077 RepID=UPI001C403CC9|nr:TetR/AcrR family transcriptional regulator [Anthocerotibacter panamensis]
MPNTRTQLINQAIALMRLRGYHTVSYADLSAVVGIKKPGIHHYFPNKEDLGEAIVAVYSEEFLQRLDTILTEIPDPRFQLEAYADLYRAGLRENRACLCGMLASEVATLPVRVRQKVMLFFEHNLTWLERVLAVGHNQGVFQYQGKTQQQAKLILSSLQGAMFVSLSLGNIQVFDEALESLWGNLGVRSS